MVQGAVVPMDGPALVFGGAYSNREATQAVLDEARRLGIPADRIISTGDMVAYGADASATVALIRAAGIHAVMGNCEESLALAAADCGCGFAPGSVCAASAEQWYRHAQRTLDDEARAWLGALPRRLDIEIGGARLAVIHGGVRRINRFLFASTPEAALAEELAVAACDGVIAGHAGLPFSRIVAGKLWHNAGAVGLPANDGTPRLWFSLLRPAAAGVTIEHRALGYDHASAAAKMRRARLSEGYAAALATGRWPSDEILPAAERAAGGLALAPGALTWRPGAACAPWPARAPATLPARDSQKFRDPARTAGGEPRATVALEGLKTLWFNTGTACNIACAHCYIESSPRNDRLAYLSAAEVRAYLDEIAREKYPTEEIGFTGGEPFLNPDMLEMLAAGLSRGFRVLVLTNAMRPMQRVAQRLLPLRSYGRLAIRVSLDHYTAALHEAERGAGSWQATLDGLAWLTRHGFTVSIAGRTLSGESETALRQGYGQLFADRALPLDAGDPAALILLPEMNGADVAEIRAGDWDRLGIAPQALMCASQRMVVKRRGRTAPSVVACTLLPYDEAFELGSSLADAARAVTLNNPACAQFCVFGGGSCSG
jgi:uncharacterized radical SAM superfamily Fe-S cluster-containing enzyme